MTLVRDIEQNFVKLLEGTEDEIDYTPNEINFFRGFLDATGETFTEKKIYFSPFLLSEFNQIFTGFKYEIKNLQKELDQQKIELNRIKANILFLKPISLTPDQQKAIQKYDQRLAWLKSIESQYKDEVIAYIEEKGSWTIIANAKTELELFVQIQELCKKNSQILKNIIEFHDFGVSRGYFRY